MLTSFAGVANVALRKLKYGKDGKLVVDHGSEADYQALVFAVQRHLTDTPDTDEAKEWHDALIYRLQLMQPFMQPVDQSFNTPLTRPSRVANRLDYDPARPEAVNE